MLVCFDALETYGKTPDQLANSLKLFMLTLAEYPEPLVRKAFEKWVRTERKLPTPADIIEMITDDNKRLLDYVHYVKSGGNLAPFAEDYVISSLGNDWRMYV